MLKNGSIKHSDFFNCYFAIYFDPKIGKTVTERKPTQKEAEDFLTFVNEEQKSYWWDK